MPPERQSRYQSPETYRTSRTRADNSWIVPFSIVVAGALIGAGIYLAKTAPPSTQVAGTNTQASVGDIIVNPITASDHILGNPNAPVKIIEFSDPECPYCKVFQQTLHQIMDTYGKNGQVAWIYREFPIPTLHKRAPNEVEAMECANEVGGNDKFWAFTDAIFDKTQSNDTLDPAELPKIASDIGLNVSTWSTCLSGNKYTALIAKDSQDAVRAGGDGTPFSVLIGPTGEKVTIMGAQPYDVVKSLVDAALSQDVSGMDTMGPGSSSGTGY